MVEKKVLIVEKLSNAGLFDFAGFYSYAHAYLMNLNYAVYELRYNEKVSGNSRDIIFEWAAQRRASDYFKYEIAIEYKINELVDVEVEIDGKKKKTNKGKIEVEVKAVLVKDPDSRWELSPIYRFLRDVYNKYVIPNRVEQTEEELVKEARMFRNEIKSYLELTGKP